MKDHLIGQVIGVYRVQQLLASKPSEVVYLAEHCESRHPVALTLFTVPSSFSSESRVLLARRFQRVAESLLTLQHRSIFPLLAHGMHFSCPYLVTPYRTNGSLTDLLKKKGAFRLESLQPILEQVTAGLTYAHHKGYIHGTLKTSYVLMQTEKTVQIAGFGLWQLLRKQGIEQIHQPYAHLFGISDTLIVSPAYVAPEVVEGKEPDVCADIYGLGCILYELLAGKPPIVGNDPLQTTLLQARQIVPDLQRFRPDLPHSVIAVLSQALAKDPDQRFQQVSHLAEAFIAAQRGGAGQISLIRSATHSGTMVGSSTLPRNAFLHFVNPADQKVSILIHLANGNFVAYERACTHVGISVDYDPQTQTLICPAHGAVFDPAHDAAVLQGPATRPLSLLPYR